MRKFPDFVEQKKRNFQRLGGRYTPLAPPGRGSPACDKKTSSFTNRTAWDDLNICITIETSTGFIYVIDKISAGLIYIYEHLSQTLLIILIFLFSYGSFHRNSDVGITISSVAIAIRQDLKEAGLARVNQHWGGVAKFFELKSRILQFFGGCKIF